MSEESLNPGPLGLMGFGFTTILLNLLNAGLLSTDAMGMILPMGLFYGGLAKTFGLTAFTSYGLFWWSFVAVNLLPTMGLAAAPSKTAVGAYLVAWGIFTALMTAATFKSNKALQVVFITLTILFFILAIGDFTGIGAINAHHSFLHLGNWGFHRDRCDQGSRWIRRDLLFAEILNETYKRNVLPIG